uniref:Uncharacterized protein n=1 Tax=Triticum urartu TaxID=4572 RepID=A0A8R7UZ06_TRIUA
LVWPPFPKCKAYKFCPYLSFSCYYVYIKSKIPISISVSIVKYLAVNLLACILFRCTRFIFY